ncbi:hypothetical protein BaRGS_00026749 [Batillaria attramentaria]|uniref:Uncharacterized protein n=1 Tax=Batillaria attramentaria TaxID=370345 RepID=A0ABD0K5F4_9CAEN
MLSAKPYLLLREAKAQTRKPMELIASYKRSQLAGKRLQDVAIHVSDVCLIAHVWPLRRNQMLSSTQVFQGHLVNRFPNTEHLRGLRVNVSTVTVFLLLSFRWFGFPFDANRDIDQRF